MEYSEFTVEQQDALLKQRIAAWEADHFGHIINKAAFEALPDGPEKQQGIEQSEAAMAVIESSVKAAKTKREQIRAARTMPAPATPPVRP